MLSCTHLLANYETSIPSPPKKLGIIGEKISDYDPKSLKLLRKLDEEDTSDTDTDSDDSNNDADQDY